MVFSRMKREITLNHISARLLSCQEHSRNQARTQDYVVFVHSSFVLLCLEILRQLQMTKNNCTVEIKKDKERTQQKKKNSERLERTSK